MSSNIYNTNLVTIAVPVYKEFSTKFELYSLERCCTILNKYPISVITHKDLNIQVYINVLEQFGAAYKVIYFEKKYFETINGYNLLMISPFFYQSFSAYKFLLIYQLDAFVFSDKLIDWCTKGFDYVGAPWLFVNWENKKSINDKLPKWASFPFFFQLFRGKDGLVGNGGFSLRKVESHIKYSIQYNGVFPSLNFNEDIFWGKFVAAKEKYFTIPLAKEALSFSIESNPSGCLKLLNGNLSFGCHAWDKEDIQSWDEVFNKAGVDISNFATAKN